MSSNEAEFIYAYYDILWYNDNGSTGENEGYRGGRMTFTRYDPNPASENNEEDVYKYRASFVYGNFEATYSCKLRHGTSFTFFDFQVLRMNQSMNEELGEDAMTFEMVDRMVDDGGHPLLYWNMFGAPTGSSLVDVYGWAKKRDGSSGFDRPGFLSVAEREKIEEFDASLDCA